ncbi:OPT-domain-containing protein [Mycena sanguinolenta]|uniref:OPT-domain-containing protein n=1 Tax=Mycena sanguinolenta TaxID=230812 RepID=A0A8H7DJB7_9AGAR|nr:OPT-domain-containing protein [Mycena sanguinolenta]
MRKLHFLEKARSSDVLQVAKAFELNNVVGFLFHHLTSNVDVIAGDIQTSSEDILEAAAYARTMSAAEVEAVINRIVEEVCLPPLLNAQLAYGVRIQHDDDPNFPPHVLNAAKSVTRILFLLLCRMIEATMTRHYLFDTALEKEHPAEYQRQCDELKVEAAMIVINSPYAEVRAVVDNHDNPQAPVGTFRTWVIGTVLIVAGAFVNQFFSIRYPSIEVGSNVAQVVAVPLAKLMELLPSTQLITFGYVWSLNPGPFNAKEHMLITVDNSSNLHLTLTSPYIQIMANVGFITPYINNVIWIQYLPLYFNQSWVTKFSFSDNPQPATLLILFFRLGYQILVALSTNLIGYGLAGLTRRFLVYPVSAIWNLATIALNRAFHSDKPTVADGWSVSRLRWFLYCFCAMFVYFWFPDFICSSLLYFNWMTWISSTNVSLAALTGGLFGLGFNPLPTFDWNTVTVTVDPLISPFFTTFNVFLGALFTFPVIVAVWYTNTWNTGYLPINSNLVFDNMGNLYSVANAVGSDTLFNQTMYESYSPAYVLIFAIVAGAVGVGLYPTNTTPVVVFATSVIIAGLFVVPIGIIMSITNVEILRRSYFIRLGGFWYPGNAVAMNYFKSYGFVTTSQAINFASDLKLAHYMHIPPQLTFAAQIYATVISTFVCTGILNFQMTKIPGVCTPNQVNHFVCADVNAFFTASVLWGTLGPKRMFGQGGIYHGLLWCFLIGAIMPIPVYFLRKRIKLLEYVHIPVLLSGGLNWGPYTLANIWPAVPIGYLFNVFIKRRYVAWWNKYNYHNPGNNLHVSGLSHKIDTRDLEAAFAKIGRVQKASVMYDPHTRESRGFGFVTMETPEEAEAAVAALHQSELGGKVIKVEKARRGRARTPTPGRYYGPPKRGDNERPYDPRPYDSRYARDFDDRGGRRGGGRYDDYRGGGGGRDYGRRDDYDRGGRDYDRGGRDYYEDRDRGDRGSSRGGRGGYDDRRY